MDLFFFKDYFKNFVSLIYKMVDIIDITQINKSSLGSLSDSGVYRDPETKKFENHWVKHLKTTKFWN